MATASQPKTEVSIEAAEDRLWDIFADHLDTLTPEKRPEVLDDLGQAWQVAVKDKSPGVPAEEVLNRLERKYETAVEAKLYLATR
jgi:hypothetical protein